MMEGINTLADLVESYVLAHDLKPGTVSFYNRLASVFATWLGRQRVPFEEFTVINCNRFLLAKQEAGLSSHYRRSLRSGLRALLNYAERPGKLRAVKWQPLRPEVWTPDQVRKLVEACKYVRGDGAKEYMRALIAVAYHTGLNEIDLRLLTRADFDAAGVLRVRRSKTGKLVVIQIPPDVLKLLDKLPPAGPLFPLKTSREATRRKFARIVKLAGLQGPFKKLRKSSGTLVESLNPGAGHLHLGNTRAVFELHYLNPEAGLRPMSPPEIPAGLVPRAVLDLPARRREVCAHIANGVSVRQIAERLGIAYQTALNHCVLTAEQLGIETGHLKGWCVEHRAWLVGEPAPVLPQAAFAEGGVS